MTCAKTRVICKIVTTDMEVFVGENLCDNPQLTCPRLEGEGYEKCRLICGQRGHAEIRALEKAKGKTKGATAIVQGISWLCRNCQEALVTAGVRNIRIEP